MSRHEKLVEYFIHTIDCDWCNKSERIKDDSPTPDGWIETRAVYKEPVYPPGIQFTNVTGAYFPPGSTFPVAFCCEDHRKLWFERYNNSDNTMRVISFGGPQ